MVRQPSFLRRYPHQVLDIHPDDEFIFLVYLSLTFIFMMPTIAVPTQLSEAAILSISLIGKVETERRFSPQLAWQILLLPEHVIST
jgi:hypothetical protein